MAYNIGGDSVNICDELGADDLFNRSHRANLSILHDNDVITIGCGEVQVMQGSDNRYALIGQAVQEPQGTELCPNI